MAAVVQPVAQPEASGLQVKLEVLLHQELLWFKKLLVELRVADESSLRRGTFGPISVFLQQPRVVSFAGGSGRTPNMLVWLRSQRCKLVAGIHPRTDLVCSAAGSAVLAPLYPG